MMATIEIEPAARQWTRSEYYAIGDLGLFEGQRVELIEGEIIVMSPENFSHVSTVSRVANVLRNAVGREFWTREEKALLVNDRTEVQPDVSVVQGSDADYTDHPTMALLVVEVSGSTLKSDRKRKASLYAGMGIQDYWIINLWERCVEVHRNPTCDANGTFAYANVEAVREDGFVTALIKPDVKIAVTHMLPSPGLKR